MRTRDLRQRIRAGERLTGTFVKMAEVTVVEVLATSGLDFLVLDAEHAGWDRGRLDACLAVGRALDLPCLVRVPEASPAACIAPMMPPIEQPAMAVTRMSRRSIARRPRPC